MMQFHCTQAPIEVCGLQRALLPAHFWRLPEEMMGRVTKEVADRAVHPVGGRVRFRTSSPRVTVRTRLATNTVDWAIPLSGSAGADVYVGGGRQIRYAGVAVPKSYGEKEGVLSFEKLPVEEDITIHLPRNEELTDVTVELEEGASLSAPTPYTVGRPMVFYGSSITEGGCASRPANTYTALLSRWLDADYVNLGFSGAAKGEPELARYLSTLDMSVLILDYDHNAPDAAHLSRTHEPFFKIIRAAQPDLPVVFMTKPDFDADPAANGERRRIICRTYQNAVRAGDQNVYFIGGETYFGNDNREACTVDGCHPNDLGFMRMAKAVFPTLRRILYRAE